MAVIASATLWPAEIPADAPYPLDPSCVLCGTIGAADAALNMLLFLPLGWLAARVWGRLPALLIGAGISACIEIAQAWIPGRYPTAGDIVWNALGAGLGACLWYSRRSVWRLPRRWRLVAAIAAFASPLIPGALMAPAPTGEEYFAQRAPNVSIGDSYRGRVTAARLEDIELPAGHLERSDAVRAALRRGATLHVSFDAVSAPERLSPFFRFVDARANEIVSLGVRGSDLIWSERTLAEALTFRSPAAAWVGALDGVVPGADVRVGAHKEGGSLCIEVDERERCGLGPTLKDGWQLLVPEFRVPLLRIVAGISWLGLPAFLGGVLLAGELFPLLFAAPLVAMVAAALPGVRFDPMDLAVLVVAAFVGAVLPRGRA